MSAGSDRDEDGSTRRSPGRRARGLAELAAGRKRKINPSLPKLAAVAQAEAEQRSAPAERVSGPVEKPTSIFSGWGGRLPLLTRALRSSNPL